MRLFALAATLATLLTASPVLAQDNGRTILVLDASNSMWGQIGGEAKITIAQRVVGDLLATLPADQELGLTLYGHRREGDCADIETVVAPGPDTRQAIAEAVNAVQPKGKTPMTDAVIAAAQALRYTDQKATVILVSDGVETCAPDPCAAADALESAGVDFTAHVIGFDITDEVAIGQMRCLAERTGGTFRAASDASELAEALKVVAAPPPPPPPPASAIVTFAATLGEDGAEIGQGLVWHLTGATDETTEPGGGLNRELLPGDYTITVSRVEDEATASASFTLGNGARLVTLVLPEIARAATLQAAAEAAVGATIPVAWTADATDQDYVSVAEPGQATTEYRAYAYTRDGNPAQLRLPLLPGAYELRYVRSSGDEPDQILATVPIGLTDLVVTITAPTESPAGSTAPVGFAGPDYPGDYLSVARTAQPDNAYMTYAYTANANPAALIMPTEPGAYEIRYVALGFPERVMARVLIAVTVVTSALDAASSAMQGSTIPVAFSGPANPGDYIAISRPDQSESEYLTYVYADQGNPAALPVPLPVGDYEIRYVAQGTPLNVLATRPISVTAAEMALEAPETAVAGSAVQVTWKGPDNRGDYLSVAKIGSAANEYRTYVYTTTGNPAPLLMPVEPGDYEIRYIGSGFPETILAHRPLTLTPVAAILTAPASGKAGTEIAVTWQGPGYRSDYIAIGLPGQPGYAVYAYAEHGNPARLTLPDAPGSYELRYVLGQGEVVIATQPFTVE